MIVMTILMAGTVISDMSYMDALAQIGMGNSVYVSGEECENETYNTRSVSIPGAVPFEPFSYTASVILLEGAIGEFEDTGKCKYLHLDPVRPQPLSMKSPFVDEPILLGYKAYATMDCPISSPDGSVFSYEVVSKTGQVLWPVHEEYAAILEAETFFWDFKSKYQFDDTENTGRLFSCIDTSFDTQALPIFGPAPTRANEKVNFQYRVTPNQAALDHGWLTEDFANRRMADDYDKRIENTPMCGTCDSTITYIGG